MHRLGRVEGFLICFAALATLAAGARAQTVLTTQIHGERRTVAISDLLDVNGVRYASLHGLAGQLGGAVELDGTRVKLDLAGGAAFLWVDGAEVESAEDAFTLTYPVRVYNGEVWVALSDVEQLLTRGFRLTLDPVGAAPAVAAPAAQVEAALEEEDLMAPMEIAPPPPQPSAGLGEGAVIVLDPGHGGHDAGVIGAQGQIEKDLSLALAREVGRVLKETTSYTVYLTRSEDKDLATADRARLANELKAQLFVSIHAGGAYSPTARGYTVLYPGPAEPARSRPLKHAETSQAVAARVARSLADGMNPVWLYHEPREAPLRLLRDVDMAALLIEAGFLTNNDDAALLGSEAGLRRAAEAIARGLAQSLEPGAGG